MWVDLEGIKISEVSKRKTSILGCHLHVESKKITQVNVYNKTGTDSQL